MLLLEANRLETYRGDRLIYKQEGALLLYRGDRLGIVGRNGAGKTTLLHTLAGRLQPDCGTVKRYGECSVLAAFEEWEQEAALSGGEKTKRKLEAALQARTPILFADEPTSHMDVDGIRRVEKELIRYDGLVVLISHDRELLDAVCTRILEVEEGKLTLYSGGYTSYRKQKELSEERARLEYAQYAKEKERLAAAIREKHARAAGMRKPPKRMGVKEARLGSEKARQQQEKVHGAAKALEARLELLKPVEKPKELPEVRFDVNGFVPIRSRIALRLEQASAAVGGRLLFEGLSANIRPGDKVALMGPNGAGKTTLLEMIRTGAPGTAVAGGGNIGYFRQSFGHLDDSRSVLDNVRYDSPYPEALIRTVLARLLFRREEALKPVGVLSGGEKVKTALAQVFLSGCNILLLDEPTNYLDLFTREEMEQVLADYPGTILFASHDRRLIARTATKLLFFQQGQVRLFDGSYDEFMLKEEGSANREPEPFGQGTLGEFASPETAAAPAPEEERLQLELELAQVLGRLSVPRQGDSAAELESRYQELLKRRKLLNH